MRNFVKNYSNCFIASLVIIIFFVLRAIYAGYTGEENRYASVAWQMYQQKFWLVPHLGYAIYPDKPPLTYWLAILGWNIQPSWQWPLIIPGIFTVGIFFLTQRISSLLFPAEILINKLAPVILLGLPYFVMHYGLVRFDMQLTFFNLLACCALLNVQSKPILNFILFAVANTFGVLAKGPVIYLFTIPEVIAFGLAYQCFNKKYLFTYFASIIFSLLLCLLWVIPVLMQMGLGYAYHLIIEQVFMRVSGGVVGGSKPVWFYLPILGLLIFPWLFFRNFWRTGSGNFQLGQARKFLCLSIILPVVILSLVESKQERYLLPLAPLLAVFITSGFINNLSKKLSSRSVFIIASMFFIFGVALYYAIAYDPHLNPLYAKYYPRSLGLIIAVVGLMFFGIIFIKTVSRQIYLIALLSAVILSVMQLGYLYAVAQARDLKPIAIELAKLQKKSSPVVSTDSLVSEMQYLGKLEKPVMVMNLSSFQHQWRLNHPNGWVLLTAKKGVFENVPNACYSQVYQRMEKQMLLCPVSVISVFCDATTQNKCFERK